MWSFAAIATVEQARADRLQSAPPWESLRQSVASRLSEALQRTHATFGLEQSSENRNWLRAVVQFHVGEELLDWFFNAQSGYRAQFRRDWRDGLNENQRLVAELRSQLTQHSVVSLTCRLLSPSFKDLGEITETVDRLVFSLDPHLSKVWACADVMDGNGAFRHVSLGLTTPWLLLPDGGHWLGISQDDPDAFLEIKGAFMKPSGLYQPKSPEARAKAISSTGEPGVK
ncbi:MAG: hypothetical protein U1E51_03215 [Candidatus Binatia bacterium]|nr:hypothetical protein [Candidatus Binatia bacterium]